MPFSPGAPTLALLVPLMKRLLVIVVAGLLVGLFLIRLYEEWPANEAAAGPNPASFARTVAAAPAELGDVRQDVTLVGSLRAEDTVDVTTKMSGRITRMNVNLGDPVRAGQIVAQLEDDELQQQLQQSEASLEVSRAVVDQRQLELRNQQAVLDRAKGLREQGLISAEELEQAQNRHDVARAQLNLAQAQLNQSEAGLRELRIRLDYTRVSAPISGHVGRRHIDAGAFVSPGTPILTLVKLDTVKLIANVPERDVVKLEPGAIGEVTVDALPGRTFQGRVARIAPLFDPQTRTGQVEIEIPNPTGELRAEMFARVDLVLASRIGVLRVPRAALVVKGLQEGVYVVEDGIARYQPVRLGLSQEDWVEVTEGLRAGDLLVTQGANLVNDGDAVRVAGATPPQEQS